MPTRSRKTKLILWAYDPFETLAIDEKTMEEFISLLKKANAVIEPVYIAYKLAAGEKDLQEAMIEGLKKFPVAMRSPRTIHCEGLSVSKAIKSFVEYAESCGADLIVVSSHGRQGIARMTLGSFAEALLISSKVPLYFLNRRLKPDHCQVNTALFATDFSKHCERAFAHFLKLAAGVFDELIIYHDMNFIYEMMAYGTMYGLELPASQAFVDEQMQWVQQEARRWVRQAQRRGFRALPVIQEKYDVSKSILDEAKVSGAGLIVLASQSGPISSLILGSHARAVFRAGEIPVLAYGPKNGRRRITQPAERQAL